MSRIYVIQEQSHRKDVYMMSYAPPFSPPLQYSNGFHREPTSSNPPPSSSGSKISPAVLFIIVILAVLFFISGLLHLLVRFLIKHPPSSASHSNNRYPELSASDALQRQLQQLFHLHDSGLDQAFIDALPVFHYREIVGLKEPFDCAVCLCEFSDKDKLRLLPICSHAFHINCIDTWLLSNSTCPLCRGTLFAPGYPIENPVFDFDDFREEDVRLGGGNNAGSEVVSGQKMGSEIEESVVVVEKGVLPVRLGKFRRVNVNNPEAVDSNVGETSSSRNLDARRCFSMGSYEYVLGNSALRVALRKEGQQRELKLSKGHEEHSGGGANNTNDTGHNDEGDLEGKRIGSVSKGESYSVSKIWLWSKKGKFSTSSTDVDLPWMEKTQGV